MLDTADVIIIGGGVMGLSSAYHLVRRGCSKVVLLEKEEFLGTGATGENAGGIRHQFSTAVNIELSKLSIAMLRRFHEETGQEIDLRFCGYLFLLDNALDLETFSRNVELQRAAGVDSRILNSDEVADLVPQFCLDGVLGASFCGEDGLADPSGVVQGYAGRARQSGVEIRIETPALEILTDQGRVTGVRTASGVVLTEHVLLAAGPWSGRFEFGDGIRLPVVPLRRQILVTRPLDGLDPAMPFVIDFSQSLYFHLEGGGILTGMSNPDEAPGFKRGLDDDWRLHHLEKAIQRLPLLSEAEVQAEWAGHYEVTPDNQPILGAIDEVPGLYACTGFSGHGFMHGPACGLLMAEEILDGRASTIDIDPLRWKRFSTRHPEGEFNVV